MEQQLVDDVFSLCIGAMRGTLTFGMPQLAPPPPGGGPAEQPPSLFWTRVVESTYYGVEVTGERTREEVLEKWRLQLVNAMRYGQVLLDLVKAFDRIPHWVMVREAAGPNTGTDS